MSGVRRPAHPEPGARRKYSEVRGLRVSSRGWRTMGGLPGARWRWLTAGPVFAPCRWKHTPTPGRSNWRREGEERFRLLVEHSSDGIYLVGPDGLVTHASPAGRRACSASTVDELVGRHLLDLLHPDDRDHAGWFFADMLEQAGRRACSASYRCLHKDGEFRHLEAVGVSRLDEPERRRRGHQLPRRHRAASAPSRRWSRARSASAPSSSRRWSASPASISAAASSTPTARIAGDVRLLSSTSCAAASLHDFIHADEARAGQRDWQGSRRRRARSQPRRAPHRPPRRPAGVGEPHRLDGARRRRRVRASRS